MMSTAISALAQRVILITRPEHQAENLAQLVEKRGGKALRFPTIALVALPESALPHDLSETLAGLEIAIFVSANAVTYSWPVIVRQGGLRQNTLVMAIGGATARALREHGVANVVHPAGAADSEALLKLDALNSVSHKQVAIFSGEAGRGLLRETLTRRGAHVQTIATYQRVRPQLETTAIARALADHSVAAITVTSAEGLNNFYAMLDAASANMAKQIPHFVPHARIAETALALGVARAIVTESGDEALVNAIEQYFAAQASAARGMRS